MKSRTSFFNGTVFKKNVTRFAPVWALYLVCLLLGLTIMHMDSVNSSSLVEFWFAPYMCICIQVMGLVNLFFAPLVAMLLFGDLYNSRICNALHAMPLRRETWFVTNVLSGLAFSLVPTAVMALLSIPLLNGTCVENAWQIAILWWLGTNLEFICFFGIAVFSVFCAGNRLAMGAVYAVLNGGAFVVYFIINTIYTPMLYGVVTPDRLASLLTPIALMTNASFVEVQSYNELARLLRSGQSPVTASFWVNDDFYSLIAYAAVGVVFMVIGLLMYRRRNLECAGDAVAVRILEPVFQVACAIGCSALGAICMELFFGSSYRGTSLEYIFLLCGLVLGWFGGKMLLERSVRVFRPRNWVGLAALTALAAASLVMTHFDVFGIERWTPRAEEVKAVRFGENMIFTAELTEKEDIEQIIRLQEMALEDRIEESGSYPLSYLQSREDGLKGVSMPSGGFDYGEGGYDTEEEHLYAAPVYIEYELESGRIVSRIYYIWASLEEGDIANKFLSDWELVWEEARRGWYDEFDINQIYKIRIAGEEVPEELATTEIAQSLLDAVKADCETGSMTQSSYFHHGYFYDEEREDYNKSRSLSIGIYTGDEENYTAVGFEIFADSENTLNWLRAHDLLTYEVCEENAYGG